MRIPTKLSMTQNTETARAIRAKTYLMPAMLAQQKAPAPEKMELGIETDQTRFWEQ